MTPIQENGENGNLVAPYSGVQTTGGGSAPELNGSI